MSEELVNQHVGYVYSIARTIKRKLPKYIDIDDLISAGLDGLWQASKSYDANHKDGANFKTFAKFRIGGAIYDWVREFSGTRSWAFRHGISTLSLSQLSDDDKGHYSPYVFKGNNWHNDPLYYKNDPLTQLCQQDTWNYLTQYAKLPYRYRSKKEEGIKLIDTYYTGGYSMKDISGFLDLSESRISQLHDYLIKRYAVMITVGLISEENFCG